jgi:hypothetical protein
MKTGSAIPLRARAALSALSAAAAALLAAGCAAVPQKDREFLADPAMRPIQDELESSLEGHNQALREGAAGGQAGSGGGCGC